MNERKLFVGCFFVVILIITWGDVKTCSGTDRMPWPPRIMMAGVVFGMLDLLSGVLGDVAPLVGVGMVIAALVNNKFQHPDCNARKAYSTAQPSAMLDAFQTQTGDQTPAQPGMVWT